MNFILEPGVFKSFCDAASRVKVVTDDDSSDLTSGNPTIWKISLEGARDTQTKRECFRENCIRIGWDHLPERIDYTTQCDSSVVRNILI
jgi:5-methylcytosine-specific restriction protein B